MSGIAFFALYVGVSLVVAAVWIRLRFAHRRQRDPSALAAPLPSIGNDFFWRFSGPYRATLLVGAGLTMLMVAVNLAAPWPLLLVVDNGILGEPLPSYLDSLDGFSRTGLIAVGAAATVVLVAIGSGLDYLATYINGAAEAHIGADIRTAAFTRMQDASVSFYEKHKTGDLLARLSVDVSHVEDMLVAWFATALPEVATVVGIVVVMTAVEPSFALAAVVVVPALAYWARRAHRAVRTAERTARDVSGSMLDDASDTLRNQKAVQVFLRQDLAVDSFEHKSREAADTQLDALERSARMTPVADVLVALGTAAVLYLGATQVLNGAISLGVLLVLLTYTSALYGPIENLSVLVLTMARGAASRDRLTELFASERSVVESVGAVDAPLGPATLRAHDVAFGYDNTWPVLRDIHFTVAPGEVVCIVGSSGAEKSSLLSLLLRLYDPATGGIEIGGIDMRDIKLASLRSRIALVPQDLWVIDGSVAANIAFGRPGATFAEVEAAAELALADEFITSLADGYDTVVGDHGTQLSGGQRRKLALARALIREAPVLILDEPTSGSDAVSAAQIWQAVEGVRGDRCLLVVTHDLDVARRSDRIYVIEKGISVESGDHNTLLVQDGVYAALWRGSGPPERSVVAAASHIAAAAVAPIEAAQLTDGEVR